MSFLSLFSLSYFICLDVDRIYRIGSWRSRIGYDPIATRRQLIALLASGNRAKALRQLRTPTLVIHGTEDPLLPFAAGEETARLIPGAKLIPVEGLGHQLPPSLMGAYAKWIAEECHAHPA